jgi:hypothetical protein
LTVSKKILFINVQVLEAWSSGLNETGYENVTSLLKNNCKRKVAEDVVAPILTLVTSGSDANNTEL